LRLFLIILVSWWIPSVSALDFPKDSLYFRVIDMKQGLPGSTITDFAQDSLGFLWIGTNDGLCRYDGSSFKVFRQETNNEQSLWSNYIQNLFIDSQDKLWIMTASGLNLFDLKQKSLIRIGVDPENGGLLDDSPIDMVETVTGDLYIASYYSGINVKKKGQEDFTYLNYNPADPSSLSSNNINNLQLLNDSLLIIGYQDAGIDLFDLKSNTCTPLSELTGEDLCTENVLAICMGGEQNIWIGTSGGLSHYNLQNGQFENYPFNPAINNFVIDREVLSLFYDQQGNLWIGTRRKGLVTIDEKALLEKGPTIPFKHYMDGDQPGNLSYRTILKIFEDRNGQVWIGTHGGGINFVESAMKRFGHLFHSPNYESSLSYNKVWGITEDREGNLWIGTDGDGLNVWKPGFGVIAKFRNKDNKQNSLSDNAVISALKDNQDRLWFGTYEGGLNRYVPEDRSFIRYSAEEALLSNDVRSIHESSQGDLYIGMNRAGVARYNNKTDLFTPLPISNMYDVRSMASQPGSLWLGTYSFGLVKMDLNSEQISGMDDLISYEGNLPFQTVYALYFETPDILWIGTANTGLCRLEIATGDLTIFSEKNGLANNKVHTILPDGLGNLWLSTNKGISRFDLHEELFYNYDWHSGVQGQEFHNGSGLVASSGDLYFGGIDGLNYFEPGYFLSAGRTPNLQFTGFSVMNSDILPFEEKIIDKSIQYRPAIRLRHKHRFFTIEFRSLNYPFSRDIKYKYMLEGYDEEWIHAGEKNRVTYKNLPTGNYRFRVSSFLNNSKIIQQEIDLTVNISPPLWRTTIAYIFYLLLFGSLGYWFFRNRLKQYEYRNQIAYQKKLREKQEKLHEERLDFFTNISHELRTPLTIISAALEEMTPTKKLQPKLKKNYDTAVRNTDRLMDLINKLMAFRRAEKGVSSLSVEPVNLGAFLPILMQDYRHLAEQKNIRLHLSLTVNQPIVWLDQDKLSMIMNNLLSNAFKNTPEGGEIVVSAGEKDDKVQIGVQDNGKGIEKQNLKKIFDRYYKLERKSTDTGIGLALTKSLVELHQGEIMVKSTPKKGTLFTLFFKKGSGHFDPEQLAKSESSIATREEGNEWLKDDRILLSNTHQILLLIDDNLEILDLLQDKFMDSYKILRADCGEEGIKLARKYSPDLIISDIMMPGISGIEVCHLLKNDPSTSHIPIILLTAKASERDEIEGLITGADDYIAKPFKFSILSARVRSILENRKKIEDYFEQKIVPSGNEPLEKPDKELLFLNTLTDYVLEHCLNENVSVFDIASDLGFSRTSLYRKVKSLTGLSINAFVRSVRIKKSAELIEQGMNVSEAAYSVGFENLKYFRDSFKKQLGKNPSELK
jgi:signal transduction histidine kinase/ligand-binding sensor domain-containing protein/DNA-binding response OmpR family regulator